METRWYVVDLLFARTPERPSSTVFCESCLVLFEAPGALNAYDRALEWAARHTEGTDFKLVGITHIHSLNEPPGDGIEVGGRFFEDQDPWGRRNELIPPLEEIPVVLFEANPNTPIGKLLDEDTNAKVRRFFTSEE